jgi:hypothetical protein
MQWEIVIGLEVHAQLSTHSKIFSGASTAYGAPPNTQACVIDLALPGVLPVLNKGAVERAIKFGCRSARKSIRRPFSRAKIISIPICRKAIKSANTNCRWCKAAPLQIQI